MSIKIEHRNLKVRKTCNDFFVQVRNFLSLKKKTLSLKVFRHKERERHNLSILAFSSAPPPTRAAPATRPLRASESQPSSPEPGLNSTFFKFPKSFARFRCVTSFALSSPRFPSRPIMTSLSDTSVPPRARVNTCVNIAPK